MRSRPSMAGIKRPTIVASAAVVLFCAIRALLWYNMYVTIARKCDIYTDGSHLIGYLHVDGITVRGDPLTSKEIKWVVSKTRVRHLDLGADVAYSDDDLDMLASSTTLESLSVRCRGPVQLRFLRHVRKLSVLALSHCVFDRQSANEVSLNGSLTYLGLSKSRVDGAAIERVIESPRIKVFAMLDSDVTGTPSQARPRHSSLKSASLAHCRFDNKWLPYITSIPSLRILSLNKSSVTDGDLPNIAGQLILDVRGTEVSTKGAASWVNGMKGRRAETAVGDFRNE